MNKVKLIDDMKERESERIVREKEILKEVGGEGNKQNLIQNANLSKYLQKFVRKMLLLTVTDQFQNKI